MGIHTSLARRRIREQSNRAPAKTPKEKPPLNLPVTQKPVLRLARLETWKTCWRSAGEGCTADATSFASRHPQDSVPCAANDKYTKYRLGLQKVGGSGKGTRASSQ